MSAIPWSSASASDGRLTVKFFTTTCAEFDRVDFDDDDRQVIVTLYIESPVCTLAADSRKVTVQIPPDMRGRPLVDGACVGVPRGRLAHCDKS